VRKLVIAVHDGSDQLACVHLTESREEMEAVVGVASAYGPVYTFDLVEGEPLQYWPEPIMECPQCGELGERGVDCCSPRFCSDLGCNEPVADAVGPGDDPGPILCPECFAARRTK
jgi:hypothetical protein